jgi:hypothetical protein
VEGTRVEGNTGAERTGVQGREVEGLGVEGTGQVGTEVKEQGLKGTQGRRELGYRGEGWKD